MKIVLIEAFDGYLEKEYILDKWEEIEELFDSIDWTKFHIFTIHYDNNNSIDISGNTSEDGLSASLTREGEIHIIPFAPQNLTFSKTILRSFIINRDSAYEKFFKEIKAFPISPKRRKIEFFRWILVLFFSSIILGPLIYISWDDLKFIGRDVGYARAKVVDIKMQSYGGRFFWQDVYYEFEDEGKSYSGVFKGGKRQGYSHVGDELKIKFQKANPEINSYFGRFIKVPKRNKGSARRIITPKLTYPTRIDSLKENEPSDIISRN